MFYPIHNRFMHSPTISQSFLKKKKKQTCFLHQRNFLYQTIIDMQARRSKTSWQVRNVLSQLCSEPDDTTNVFNVKLPGTRPERLHLSNHSVLGIHTFHQSTLVLPPPISLSHYGQNLPFLGYCLSSLKSLRQLKQCE